MALQHPFLQAFSVLALAAVALSPRDGAQSSGSRGVAAVVGPTAGMRASQSAPSSSSSAPKPEASASPAAPSSTVCGEGMLLVDGEYCPDAEQVCLKWLDPPPYQNLRCGEYAKPVKCKGPKQHRRFCIDRDEYVWHDPKTGDVKDPLPVVGKKWGEAQTLCAMRGARLCKESEWEFACEGPEASPYPYGFTREPGACNHDRTDLGGAEDKLTDHRATADAYPKCTSPFGVHHMTGNVDEWVEREGAKAPNRSALRGGWWLPGRNRCRAATLGHDETYSGKQVGFRCCKDAPAP